MWHGKMCWINDIIAFLIQVLTFSTNYTMWHFCDFFLINMGLDNLLRGKNPAYAVNLFLQPPKSPENLLLGIEEPSGTEGNGRGEMLKLALPFLHEQKPWIQLILYTAILFY